MDQAFTPGTTEFDVLARNALALRRPEGATVPTTSIFSTSGSLQRFMQELPTGGPFRVPRPIPEIILLSHAAESGWLEMALTDDDRNETQFEILTRVGTALNIPEEVLTPTGGAMVPAIVRVRGCRIGIASEFMLKFKQALKNVSLLVAPKHYQGAGTWNDESNTLIGRTEFLMYCFESYPKERPSTTEPMAVQLKEGEEPKPIARQKVIDALKADGHKFFEDTAVPAAQWGTWFTQLGVKTKVRVEKYSNKMAVRLPAAWMVDPNEGDLSGAFVFEHVITTNNGPWEIGDGPAKGTAAQRRAFVKGKLADPATKAKFPIFFSDHSWPIWKRYLKIRNEPFASLDEFMQGFDWVSVGTTYIGMRHVYRLLVPITMPVNSNILLANYYPLVGPARIGLDETNPRLFVAL